MKRSRGLVSSPVAAQPVRVGQSFVEVPFNYLLRIFLRVKIDADPLISPERVISTTSLSATGSIATLRSATPFSMKATISNLGPYAVRVFESGKTLAILEVNESRDLPMRTTGEITAQAIGGDAPSATVQCTTQSLPS